MTRKNLGPCSIHNCQINSNQYRGITTNALRKAKENGTFDQYNYLEFGKQLCYPHYLSIIEPDRNKKLQTNSIRNNPNIPNIQNNVIVNNNNIKPLSFANKITLMTKVLYEKQRKENTTLELDPNNFQTMLENAEPLLKGFFNELYNSFTPDRRSAYNKNENKKKVVSICYSIAAIRNKFVNQYPLEIGLYLTASGASCDAINTMHNAGISVCYKTVENYKKKIANAHPENIRKYFTEKVNTFLIY
jgi:hypothetical protein